MRGQPALPALPPNGVRCTRCDTDLSSLSTTARFCPRCGLKLNDDRPTGVDRVSRFARLVAPRHAEPPTPTAPSTPFTSMIVRGYANAMYRLGVRYEVRRNEAEAVRCYGKASHLGNEPATSRLLDIPLARCATDRRPRDGGGVP